MNSIEAKLAACMYQDAVEMAKITIDHFAHSGAESAPDDELAARILHIATTPDGTGMDRLADIAHLLGKYREAAKANQEWRLILADDQN